MFKTRLISGILLVIALIAIVGIGGNLLLGVLAVVSIIGLSELYKVMGMEKKAPGMVGYLATIMYYGLLFTNHEEYITCLSILFLVITMGVYVFSFPSYRSEHIMLTFFGFFYVAMMLSYVYQTRELPQGGVIVWLIFLSSWGCDTCAYCVGMLFGKHKMAPKLSPKKSVEGGLGGIIGAGLLGVIFTLAMNAAVGVGANPAVYGLICAVGGGISQIGDLAASAIKRNHDIKDYGKLIPGHGGILDRFDSVIFTAPIIYYLMVFFVK